MRESEPAKPLPSNPPMQPTPLRAQDRGFFEPHIQHDCDCDLGGRRVMGKPLGGSRLQ
jgi:hypothetical protein